MLSSALSAHIALKLLKMDKCEYLNFYSIKFLIVDILARKRQLFCYQNRLKTM